MGSVPREQRARKSAIVSVYQFQPICGIIHPMDKPLNLAALVASDRRPEPWEEGSQKMWTDPYIREHIVYAHLEPHEDDGSKPFDQIQAEVEHWVRTFGGTGRVLDLGCGPGIYLREMALRDGKGIGLDFNQSAILYAQDLNRDEGLSLEYRWGIS
jgi:SAM-dependent methyltransferase